MYSLPLLIFIFSEPTIRLKQYIRKNVPKSNWEYNLRRRDYTFPFYFYLTQLSVIFFSEVISFHFQFPHFFSSSVSSKQLIFIQETITQEIPSSKVSFKIPNSETYTEMNQKESDVGKNLQTAFGKTEYQAPICQKMVTLTSAPEDAGGTCKPKLKILYLQ